VSTHVRYDVADLGVLTPFPGNPRVGDVGAIRRSLARFGQFRTLVCWCTDGQTFIVAGNHTALGMRELAALTGERFAQLYPRSTRTPADYARARIEINDYTSWDEARRENAADNRTAELGGYDDAALLAMLTSFGEDLDGLGWTAADVAALKPEFEPTGEPPPPLDQLEPRPCPRCGYDVANDPERLASTA
jgi:hypothetical protein